MLERFDRADWIALPREGCRNVDLRVLLREGSSALAMLRFGVDATIDEHAGDTDTIVFCLEGSGFVSVGEQESPFEEGDRVRWPKGVNHRLWTTDQPMITLMFHPDVP